MRWRVLHCLAVGAFLLTNLGVTVIPSGDQAATEERGLGRNFFVPVGINLGGAMGERGRFHVGGELSAVWTSRAFNRERPFFAFWGLYADMLYVPAKGYRFTVGPELGWTIFTVDGGYEGISDDSGFHHGFAVRALTHIPRLYLSAYARGHYVTSGFPFFDFGVLLKLPLGYRPDYGYYR